MALSKIELNEKISAIKNNIEIVNIAADNRDITIVNLPYTGSDYYKMIKEGKMFIYLYTMPILNSTLIIRPIGILREQFVWGYEAPSGTSTKTVCVLQKPDEKTITLKID